MTAPAAARSGVKQPKAVRVKGGTTVRLTDGDRALKIQRAGHDQFLASVQTASREYLLSLTREQVADLAAGCARLLA